MKFIFTSIFLLSLISCQKNNDKIFDKDKANSIKETDTSSKSMVFDSTEEDSILYHDVVADYGNYWETTTNDKQKKQVLFDLFSGKIAIYMNKNDNEINNHQSSDYNFSMEIDTLNPYLIKGVYGEIDRDTILFWKFNPKTKIITDEKGLKYHLKKLK